MTADPQLWFVDGMEQKDGSKRGFGVNITPTDTPMEDSFPMTFESPMKKNNTLMAVQATYRKVNAPTIL